MGLGAETEDNLFGGDSGLIGLGGIFLVGIILEKGEAEKKIEGALRLEVEDGGDEERRIQRQDRENAGRAEASRCKATKN